MKEKKVQVFEEEYRSQLFAFSFWFLLEGSGSESGGVLNTKG